MCKIIQGILLIFIIKILKRGLKVINFVCRFFTRFIRHMKRLQILDLRRRWAKISHSLFFYHLILYGMMNILRCIKILLHIFKNFRMLRANFRMLETSRICCIWPQNPILLRVCKFRQIFFSLVHLRGFGLLPLIIGVFDNIWQIEAVIVDSSLNRRKVLLPHGLEVCLLLAGDIYLESNRAVEINFLTKFVGCLRPDVLRVFPVNRGRVQDRLDVDVPIFCFQNCLFAFVLRTHLYNTLLLLRGHLLSKLRLATLALPLAIKMQLGPIKWVFIPVLRGCLSLAQIAFCLAPRVLRYLADMHNPMLVIYLAIDVLNLHPRQTILIIQFTLASEIHLIIFCKNWGFKIVNSTTSLLAGVGCVLLVVPGKNVRYLLMIMPVSPLTSLIYNSGYCSDTGDVI